jgi:hypothetical protein
MRRTLLAVGFAVLASLLYVPEGCRASGVWRVCRHTPFWNAEHIMFVSLLVQTTFAAVATAIAVNTRWRTLRRVLLWIGAGATLGLIAFGPLAFQQEMKRSAESEEWTARGDIDAGKFDSAKQHLLKASNYWWWKGWWEGARRARQRAFDEQGMKEQAAAFRAKKDAEARAKAMPVFDPSKPFEDLIPQGGRSGGKYLSTDPNAGFDPDSYLAKKSGAKDIFDLVQWQEEEKLIHDPIDYQTGIWTTGAGKAFAVAKFFERNLGDRKPDLDALADKLGAQKRYTLIEKQKRGGVWWVRVFLYKR